MSTYGDTNGITRENIQALLKTLPLSDMFSGTQSLGGHGDWSGTKCPCCGFEYVNFGAPMVVKGNDNYEAGWGGRGDLLMILFTGECGGQWKLCFGFHKGCTDVFLKLLVDCRLLGDDDEEEQKIDYKEYINSPEWKAKADAEKERAGWRCEVCNTPRDKSILDTHHRTYERIGDESPGDLIVLCRDCHKLFHKHRRISRPG